MVTSASPLVIPYDSLDKRQRPYRLFGGLRVQSVYPIVQGYKHTAAPGLRVNFADLLQLNNASVVIICWTLQFVRPLKRETLINKIYNGLNENGVLIITEKILTNSSLLNRYYIKLYYDYKQRNQYTYEEITNKREALENILIPYRIDENIEMFKRNGFTTVDTFFQWYNFVGFICIKSRNPIHENHP